MNHINYFSDIGLDINITPDSNLSIKGLSSLQKDLIEQVVQHAKENKWRIIFELQTQNKTLNKKITILWKQADKLADWIDDERSDTHWKERRKYVPQVLEMGAEIDRLELK